MNFYKTSLNHFGIEDRMEKLIEEMAELMVELKHFKDGKSTKERVRKEIADVYVLINTIAVFFGAEIISDMIIGIELKVAEMIDAECRKIVEGEPNGNAI